MLIVWALAMLFLPRWLTHIEMTKEDVKEYGWATYKQFKENFNKYEWTPLRLYPDSCSNDKEECYFHASIIKMGGKGMLIRDPISLMLVKRYVKNVLYKKPEKPIKSVDLWKEANNEPRRKQFYF